jgi:hypothetical protein
METPINRISQDLREEYQTISDVANDEDLELQEAVSLSSKKGGSNSQSGGSSSVTFSNSV